MKKLYISSPMTGRSKENIEKTREKLKKIAEAIFDQELEVIDILVPAGPPQTKAIAIWQLSENIKKMAAADYFIGISMPWSLEYPELAVEECIAREYDIESYFVEYDLVAPDLASNNKGNRFVSSEKL